MQNGTPAQSARPWRDVAAEVMAEHNSDKVAKLVEELNRALEEQGSVKCEANEFASGEARPIS
jgi:hypothetical protein